jgi:hypothetical protein
MGASMDDATAAKAPFDLRYLYIAGGMGDGTGPCTSCASGCTAQNKSCANSGGGCVWWGCWQYDQVPPGAYLRDFFRKAKSNGQIPLVTYYMMLSAGGTTEGAAEVAKANDITFMRRYYADFQFALQQAADDMVLFHVEPDFWGFAEQVDADPSKIPAAVASANPTDCGALPNTIAGLGQCMIAIAHNHARNAKVSLHGSPWATKISVLENTDPRLDVAGEATKLAQFLAATGPDADFITVDGSDRDAGFYQTQGRNTWWDVTNATLPNFAQAFAWSRALGNALGKPVLFWQLPVGNLGLPNVSGQWKDNRVDYFLTHMQELALANGFGAAFGAGTGGQTDPSTDGGNLVTKVQAYAATSGQKPCP